MYTITRSITLKHGEKVNVKLIVKEEDRKVIAIADEKICGSGYLKFIAKRIIYDFFINRGLIHVQFAYDSKLGNDLNLESYYRTIATCDPDDTWDEKTGIKIALNKMKSKLDLAIDKRLSLFLNKLDKGVESFADKFFLNE